MRLEVLLSGLESPQPAVRLDVVRVLGMLDETHALDALRARYKVEPDAAVRNAISWAGKHLFQAQQAGYSTIDELCRHFGIDREIDHMPDAAEQELMEKMQRGLDRDLLDMQGRAGRRRIGMAVVAGLGGSLVGGTGVGMSAMAGALMPGADSASGAGGRPQIGTKRTPATAPTNTDIDVWVRRLRDGSSPEMREQAAIQLAEFNNPKALPHLAAAFLADTSPKVRQAAQRFGKILYWSTVYWEMEQDGSMAEEMQRRAAAVGKEIKLPKAGPANEPPAAAAPGTGQGDAPSPPQEVDVSEILRKAKQARAERKRKNR